LADIRQSLRLDTIHEIPFSPTQGDCHTVDYSNHGEIEVMATTSDGWRVVCQDPEDGSGDVIVELPSELLEALGWELGDELIVEKDPACISLKLKRQAGQPVS
jgi:hypothetical protein